MPAPHTVYKGDKAVGSVYPSDLQGWLDDGWSLTPPEKVVEKVKPIVDLDGDGVEDKPKRSRKSPATE